MGIPNRQIGWSQMSNLLYQFEKKLKGQNGDVSKEIGWSTENNLLHEIIEEVACSPCVPPTTSPTTTIGRP